MKAKQLKRTDTDILRILKRYRKDYNIQSDIVNELIDSLLKEKKTNTSEVKERKKKAETI